MGERSISSLVGPSVAVVLDTVPLVMVVRT
jgi:hypothetical protein